MSGSELVVGVDGSAGALAAVRWAARVARERRRGLRLVHALPELPAPYPRADPTYEQLLEAAAGQGRTMLAEARARGFGRRGEDGVAARTARGRLGCRVRRRGDARARHAGTTAAGPDPARLG